MLKAYPTGGSRSRIDNDYLTDLFQHVEQTTEHIAQNLGPLTSLGDSIDVLAYAENIVPRDDSALQLSAAAGGIADDPEEALRRLFDRYVNRYRAAAPP